MSDAIKPSHYRTGEIDLIESWYRTRPFNEFRAIMEALAERYIKRQKTNRIEDIEKAIYVLTRLKEYEQKEKGVKMSEKYTVDNKTVLVGRITRDPEVKKTQSGVSVVSFTLAVNRPFKKDGEQEADFINCVAWRNTADFMGNYIKKGALLGIDGRIQTRNYEDKTGQRVYITEVVAESVQLLEWNDKPKTENTTVEDDFEEYEEMVRRKDEYTDLLFDEYIHLSKGERK